MRRLCALCHVKPVRLSRRPNTTLCEDCKAARERLHNARGYIRRRPTGLGPPTIEDRRAWFKDLSAEEIERRFSVALREIRKRRSL